MQVFVYSYLGGCLKEVHKRQPRNKVKGIDDEDKTSYEDNLDENLDNLIERMKAFQYRPLPVRRAYIPKVNGKKHP